MLSFFKRSPASFSPSKAQTQTSPASRPRANLVSLDPLPIADVVEGNSEADWAMWEDSVSFQDSQFPGVQPESIRVRAASAENRNSTVSEDAPPDAFASVGRNSS